MSTYPFLRAAFPLVLALPIGAQSTIRVSTGLGGADPDAGSTSPHVSGDGRFVAFLSAATNLALADTNVGPDVFLYLADSATIEVITVREPGPSSSVAVAFPAVSDDGNLVVFATAAPNVLAGSLGFADIYVRDRSAGTTTRITSGWTGNSGRPAMTPDGRYVAFESLADNVVPGGPQQDVFLHDRQSLTTVLVSRNTVGTPGNGASTSPSISTDGRIVTFASESNNFLLADTNSAADVFVRDVVAGTTRRASVGWLSNELNAGSTNCNVSGDGQRVLFMNVDGSTTSPDTNGAVDVYSFDRQSALTTRVSTPPSGQGGDGQSLQGTISRDGRYVAFRSWSTDLLPADPTPATADLYMKDLETESVELVSLSSTDAPSTTAETPSISADARFVAFRAEDALVPGDANGLADVYLRDRGAIVYTTPCAGDGSSTPCPCANPGYPGNGCENYGLTGGARLSATGTPSVTNDTIRLVVTGFPIFPTAMGFSQGDALLNNGFGAPFGDGVRCIGGNVLRLRQRQSISGESAYGFGIPGDPPVSVQGQVGIAGGTRYYQVSYRSIGSFCFQQKVNWSNSIAIVWAP